MYKSSFQHCSSEVKASACNAGDPGSIPGLGRSPGEGNGNHSSILAWRIPWTAEPGGLQSMGSQRVGHDWATSLSFNISCKASEVVMNSHSFCLPGEMCISPNIWRITLLDRISLSDHFYISIFFGECYYFTLSWPVELLLGNLLLA